MFISGNKLYAHIKSKICPGYRRVKQLKKDAPINVFHLLAPQEDNQTIVFKNQIIATGKVSLEQNGIKIKAVFNLIYRPMYIDKEFLNITKPNISIYLIKLIQLRNSDKLHIIDRFINLDI